MPDAKKVISLKRTGFLWWRPLFHIVIRIIDMMKNQSPGMPHRNQREGNIIWKDRKQDEDTEYEQNTIMKLEFIMKLLTIS